MNWRGWILTGLLLVVVAALGLGGWRLAQRAPTQILTLPNGAEYRFTGVSYGTNHVMSSRWSAAINKLPKPLTQLALKLLGGRLGPQRRHSSNQPSLVVWFEPLGTNVGVAMFSVPLQAMLIDENGIVSGESEYVSASFGGPPPQWISEQFNVWPRRSRMLECVLFQYDYGQTDSYRELGRFRFRNPAPGKFPNWQPEPLPATRHAGDITVTLHDFHSGVGSGGGYRKRGKERYCEYRAAEPGKEPEAAVRFTIESPRGTNESWAVDQFFLSDATGNDRKATSWSHSVGSPAHFSPVLWPDEQAWKLTTRLKRKTGMPESDLLVFREVPLPEVGRTNVANLTNRVHDIECVLASIVLRPPMTNNSYSSRDLTTIELKYADLPDGFAMDLVSVTFDDPTVEAKTGSSSWGGSEYKTHYRVFPTNQTHATITYAVQKTREVEFLVPPNWVDATNTVELKVGED